MILSERLDLLHRATGQDRQQYHQPLLNVHSADIWVATKVLTSLHFTPQLPAKHGSLACTWLKAFNSAPLASVLYHGLQYKITAPTTVSASTISHCQQQISPRRYPSTLHTTQQHLWSSLNYAQSVRSCIVSLHATKHNQQIN